MTNQTGVRCGRDDKPEWSGDADVFDSGHLLGDVPEAGGGDGIEGVRFGSDFDRVALGFADAVGAVIVAALGVG
jgi:hypothetical protein